jgi:hypothetical protein
MARFRIVRSALKASPWIRWTSVACQSNKGPVDGGAFAVTLVRKVVTLHVHCVAVSLRDPCANQGMDCRADLLLQEVGQHFSRVRLSRLKLSSVYTN